MDFIRLFGRDVTTIQFYTDQTLKSNSNMISGILLIMCTALTKMTYSVKTFKPMTSSNGQAMCALGASSYSVKLSPGVCPVPQCAWLCTKDPPCIGFNFNQAASQCEFYYKDSKHYDVSDNCAYYGINVSVCNI